MVEIIKVIVAALAGGLMGMASAWFTARLKLREIEKQFELKLKELETNVRLQQDAEKAREKAKIKVQYLNPLRVAAGDLVEKVKDIQAKLTQDGSRKFLKDTFTEIKEKDREQRDEFARWCNGFGHYAMSTIYVTAVYFAHASKIRFELPFIDLDPKDDQVLLDHLSNVRKTFGGEYNLWETIQDSTGSYLRKADGTILNYKEFCEKIIDKAEHLWFLRLIDFYRDIDMKQGDLPKIHDSLTRLIQFVRDVSRPANNS